MAMNGFDKKAIKTNLKIKAEEDNCKYFFNKASKSTNSILGSAFVMKLGWTFKNMVSCYMALIAVLGLQFFSVFAHTNRYTFQEVISDVQNCLVLGLDISFITPILSKLLMELGFLVFAICIYSGILFLYKKVLNHELISINDFLHGIGKNFVNIFLAGICFSLTINIIIYIVQILVTRHSFSDNMMLIFTKLSIAQALGLFFNALVVYGTLVLAEFVILLFFSFLYEIVDIIKRNYMFNIYSRNGLDLYTFMDIFMIGIPS